MNITILSIYFQRSIKFEIVGKDIFGFFEPFYFHYSMRFTITRKPWHRFCSNFQRIIIIMLPICTQRLTEFNMVVWDISFFFNRFGVGIFPLLRALHSKTVTCIWLKISEDDYEFAIYLLQMFDWIWNCSLLYFRLFGLRFFPQMQELSYNSETVR